MSDLELLELLPLAEEFEMKYKRRELTSPERQVLEYVKRFERTADFPAKSDVEIELADGFVVLEYSVKSGTVYVDRFVEDEDVNLSIEQKIHFKYMFVDAMEKRYSELNESENENWNNGIRNITS